MNTENLKLNKKQCSYDKECKNKTFKHKGNDLYYCYKHNAISLLEELDGNLSAGKTPESVEVIQDYLEEAIESLKKIKN